MAARTTTTISDTPSCTPTAAEPASTTSTAVFNAARSQGNFGRYGFDGVSKPLASTASMQNPPKPSAARGWSAKLYPSAFMPKSLAGKVLLAPLGLLMLAGAAIRLSVARAETVSEPESTGAYESYDEMFERTGINLSLTEDIYRE